MARTAERLAFDIVWHEETEDGRFPVRLTKIKERQHGCDMLVYLSAEKEGEPQRVEVKGLGNPLLNAQGHFIYGADINREQYARAVLDPNWRLEIVGNLSAVAAGTGTPERLSLTAEEVMRRSTPWKFSVSLDGLEESIAPGVVPR